MVTGGVDLLITMRTGFGDAFASVRTAIRCLWPSAIEEVDEDGDTINVFFYADEVSNQVWSSVGCTPEYADRMIQVSGTNKKAILVVDHISEDVEVLMCRITSMGCVIRIAHEGKAYSPLAT